MVSRPSIIDDDTESPQREEVRDVENLSDLTIESFISSKSRKFLERFGINQDFSESDPTQPNNNNNYEMGFQLVKNLKVRYNTVERAIK